MSIRRLAKRIYAEVSRKNIEVANNSIESFLQRYEKTSNGLYLAATRFGAREVPESTIMESVYKSGEITYFPAM